MKRSLGLFLFVLIVNLAISHLAQAQSQAGFISLDCGLPVNEESPYNETEATGLLYSSDATFIQSGNTDSIPANQEDSYLKPLWTLRYFPEGKRNCYDLNVEKGRNHLITARFVYENYDGDDDGPKFDLYLGPNLWATVDLRGNKYSTWEEILHIPTSNLLQICLVKTGRTTPMISSLEIRPMGNDSYITTSGSLKLLYRECFTESGSYMRFPDDVYDRRWWPYFRKQWTQINTTREVAILNDYDPPKDALATAAIPTDATEPWTYEWSNSDNPSASYYLYAHFAEIQDLQANDTRQFNILFNGQQYDGPLIPKKLEMTTIVNSSPRTCDGGECSFQLTRTDRSTLPPLLNALEVYTVIQFPHSETEESDVIAIKSIKDAYKLNRIDWQGDPCVPQYLMWDGLNCSISTNISTPPRITSLDLSSTGLTGTISTAIQNLTKLEKLDLSNNKLSGGVPEFLGNVESLTVINLSGNNLNGSIPQALQKGGLELSVEGNPRLYCASDSCAKSTKKKFPLAIVVASVAVAAIVISVLLLFLVIRKKKSTVVEGLHLLPGTSAVNATFANKSSRRFTYSEVVKMTNNFQRVLGNGGFGMVYHGSVNGYEQVAVKVLSQSSTQGYKEFKAEVDLLMRVHHTNLVSLVGYCYEGDHLALIYEFLPNGDLKQHLSGKGGGSIINWSTRLRIALEAAQGLEYLHIGCKPPMVHRDIKTANILLDENFEAKIADFGLSRSFQGGGDSEESTVIAGSRGYLDPEYNHSGRLGEKSDVYSFGIVLLEIITNQPVSNQTSEYSHISQWVGFQIKRGYGSEISQGL
ncbi:PREDICTED: probable LRR receptor-like serine/threonine-protein kinase At5g59680 isoform X2 [Camelina sativa]|uniref:non-specific serine/threonine protein kinase n=1 Tax=Camelina sativa TaxID=90675 RepID=A0ABM0XBS3_CAMSA|nr:PREDICTED: probable LRR receptor-like serine/threonine-protein kinase At5g59680 isoform X2 [Camelina sativa]